LFATIVLPAMEESGAGGEHGGSAAVPTAFAVDSSNPAWLDTVIGNSEQKEKGKNESGAQFIKQLLSGRGLSFNEGTRPGTVMELLSTEHAGELLASFPTADSYTPTEYAKKRTTDAIGVVFMCACDDAWVQIKTDSVKQKLGDSSRPKNKFHVSDSVMCCLPLFWEGKNLEDADTWRQSVAVLEAITITILYKEGVPARGAFDASSNTVKLPEVAAVRVDIFLRHQYFHFSQVNAHKASCPTVPSSH
jgi:hypothetical protein